MFNALNVANVDSSFDGEGINVNIDSTQKSAFSFNNLLSLDGESQINNTEISLFDNFLNSSDISEIDLKHLSNIIDKNPIASLEVSSKLITKLDTLKINFIDDSLIENIKNKLNNIKPTLKTKSKSQTLSDEFRDRILFTSNNNQLKEIKINSIQDIEKISDKYELNISKIKIKTYENLNSKNHKTSQLQTNIDTSKVFNTTDAILLKEIKNKNVNNVNNTIKDIFTSFNKNPKVQIQTTPINSYTTKEVEASNRLAFFHKSKIETLKDSQSFKDIIQKSILPNNSVMTKKVSTQKEVISNQIAKIINPIQTQLEIKKTTSFYKYEPTETVNIDNKQEITLKNIFDLKNEEKIEKIKISQETSKQASKKTQLIRPIFSMTSNSKPASRININLDSKASKTKLLNLLVSNNIKRTAIKDETQDNQRVQSLMQEISQMSQESSKLSNNKLNNTSDIKIEIEPVILNENTNNNETTQSKEPLTEHKNSIIDVSKFAESNQSKELNQIMQRQIINGVYENLKYKLNNFIAPLMKFSLELKPSNLGKIEVAIMVRGNNLHVNIKSSKKVSSLLESEESDLEKEFSILGYKNITIEFDNEGDSSNDNKPKENNDFNIQRDSK